MVRYSARAARALGFLKRHKNDIEVYVEDTSNRSMWLSIISRCVPASFEVKSINMLGGRRAVEDACALDQGEDGRKRIYIIDSDFDHLLGKSRKRLKYFHRLNVYCVENLLLSEAAAQALAADSMHNDEDQHVRDTLDFTQSVDEITRMLKPLFAIYATAYKLDKSILTVGHSVKSLLKSGGGQKLDVTKVRRRGLDVIREIKLTTPLATYKKEFSRILANSQKLPLEKVVSGKDYVLPVMWLQMKTRCDYKGNEKQFKSHLARLIPDKSIAPLRRAITKACS